MKRSFLFASLFAVFGCSVAFAAPPSLFFSDLTSGPKTGGKDNNGVFVTLVGKNFGSSRGTNNVSVGGGQAAAYALWSDNKIIFQPGANAATGNMVVTTGDGSSNGIRFVVRSGNIYFVSAASPANPGSGTYSDPWRSPASFFQNYRAGDTCYFRAGIYSGRYGNQTSRPYNISFYGTGSASGAADNEVAWVGYPCEVAKFVADDSTVYNGAIEITNGVEYHVFANLSIYGRGDGREQVRLNSSNNKLVNCKIEGIKTLSYGMVGVTASNLKIWGNEMFGAASGNKLDHIIYWQGGGDNVDVGWNYIHDNNIAVGPIFSWNLGAALSTNTRIHDNYIDCRNSSDILRLAGIWSGGGGSVYFYNNQVIETGGSLNNDNAYNGIYVGFGTAYIYNNTFYRSRGAGSSYVINVYAGASGVVKNNIFYNQSECRYVNLASGNLTLDSNLYYGSAGSVPSGDPNPIRVNPQFVSAGTTAWDLHIKDVSPCVDKGVDVASVVSMDYDGVARSAGKIDLGAFEYYVAAPAPAPGPTPTVVTTATITGYIRDAGSQPIIGTLVTLSGGAAQSVSTDANGLYSFRGLSIGLNFVVSPSKTGYTFNPQSITVSSLSADVSGNNFTGTQTISAPPSQDSRYISGYAKDLKGNPISGAGLSISGSVSGVAESGADGSYLFDNLITSGSYAVSIIKNGWIFDPASFDVSELVSNLADQNFTGRHKYHIKGKISNLQGIALKSVQVSLTGSAPRQTVTDEDGYYEFLDLPENISYSVRSDLGGYYFVPADRSTSSLAGYIESWDFEGAFINNELTPGGLKVMGSSAGRGTVNPDKGESSRIYFKGSETGVFECRIFTLLGDVVWEDKKSGVTDGTFEWIPRSIASGTYIVNVKGPGINDTKKISILR